MLITNNAVRINSYLNCHGTNSDNFHTSLYCHAVKGWPVAPVQTFDLSEPLVRPHIPQEWSHNCAAACCDPRTEGQINALDRVQTKAAQFTNHTKDSDWETLAQRRTIARLCELFKANSGERTGKLHAISCEGLTIWVGLIMFGKLGTGSKERISVRIPL